MRPSYPDIKARQRYKKSTLQANIPEDYRYRNSQQNIRKTNSKVPHTP